MRLIYTILVFLLLLVIVGLNSFAQTNSKKTNYDSLMAESKFLTLDKDTITFKDLNSKYIYLEIWGTWCAPCIKEIPYLENIIKDYKDEDIVFLNISIDRNHEKWEKFVTDKKLNGIQIRIINYSDIDYFFDKMNGNTIINIPRFIILNKEGEIVNISAPRPSNKELKVILNELLRKN